MTKHSNLKKGKRPSKLKKSKAVSVESLLEKAQEAMQSVQLEEAADLYERALAMQPSNTDIMDSLADVCIQLGNMQRALVLLNESITAAPQSNGTKWLYLAQLLPGQQAVGSYQTGIQILESHFEAAEGEQKLALSRSIAGAFCSIAELFMTDLCFEENAERYCEEAVSKALAIEPNSLEAKLTLSSLRISQCKKEEAVRILQELCPLISASIKEFRSRNIIDEITGTPNNGEHAEFLPCPDNAVSFVKLLMECSNSSLPNFYESIHETLEYVLDIDDENPDLWYLMGVNANNRIRSDEDAAVEAFSTAKAMLEEMLKKDPTIEDASCLLQKVEFALKHIGTPDIHLLAEKQSAQAQVVCDIADGAAMEEEEWSDDES